MAMVLCGTDIRSGAFGAREEHHTRMRGPFQQVYLIAVRAERSAEDAKGAEGLAEMQNDDDAHLGSENVLSLASGGGDERTACPPTRQRTCRPRVPTFQRRVDGPDFARVGSQEKRAEAGSRGRSPTGEVRR